VKPKSHETEENITSLTAQGVDEILETKKIIIKEDVEDKESSQKFIHGWRSVKQF
jgi:hypothetical protein